MPESLNREPSPHTAMQPWYIECTCQDQGIGWSMVPFPPTLYFCLHFAFCGPRFRVSAQPYHEALRPRLSGAEILAHG